MGVASACLPPQCPYVHAPQMPLVQGALGSADPYQRKAALMCLAVLAEGCGDHIRSRYVLLGGGVWGRGAGTPWEWGF